MTTLIQPVAPAHPTLRVRLRTVPLTTIAIIAIVAVGAFLRLYNLSAVGDANTYYTAAVKSMLQSWHNFFYVVAEPGGSVTVDKPPLGLWIQAIFAFFLGVQGWVVVLPQALAGIISIPILYHLIKKPFGTAAGLFAALVLALTPVAIAVERNNTMDGTLILTLLLAAWAFIKATESGKLRYLWLGAVLVGLGFNIKMMQAYLPLPAFFALYFLGSKHKIGRKVLHLAAAAAIVLTVSLSWAVAVDLTPADQRPYIGSSENNSVLNLIFGYNGLGRLTGEGTPGAGNMGGIGGTVVESTEGFAPPATTTSSATTDDGQLRDGGTPPTGGMMGGGVGGTGEIGSKGVLRLFTTPLVNEIGWLLPLGLASIALVVVSQKVRYPLGVAHQAVVLWGGWLVTCVTFFSIAGFFHAYYLSILGIPLAAMLGVGLWAWLRLRAAHPRIGALLLVVGAGLTLAFQAVTAANYVGQPVWLIGTLAVATAAGAAMLIVSFVPRFNRRPMLTYVAAIVIAGALLITPGFWSVQTTLASNSNSALPSAYSGQTAQAGFRDDGSRDDGGNRAVPTNGGMGSMMGTGSLSDELLAYLDANTQGQRYMVAVSSSHEGDAAVLKLGRGILFMGGFAGSDEVVTADSMAALVKAGDLSYVLDSGSLSRNKPEVAEWLKANCSVVDSSAWGGSSGSGTLYQCVAS